MVIFCRLKGPHFRPRQRCLRGRPAASSLGADRFPDATLRRDMGHRL